mmetsp:Transcript_4788/g.5536  ORF Transcript_4788/g.5536 Transcript_4788/m.5536 type:complete len:274 (+) Transcript_4788:103-924(+)
MENQRRENIMALAKLAYEVGRPKEALEYYVSAIKSGFETSPDVEVSGEERVLIAKVFKQNLVDLMTSVKEMDSLVRSKEFPKNERADSLLTEYRIDVVKDLVNTCLQIVQLVSEILLPTAKETEAKVFYGKIAGDFSLYVAKVPRASWKGVNVSEFNVDSGIITATQLKEYAVKKTENFYTMAHAEAQTQLSPTHPVRLGLELNMSIFYYEMKRDIDLAIEFAKDAFDDAIAELDEEDQDQLSGENKKVADILQLLKKNLKIWESKRKNASKS